MDVCYSFTQELLHIWIWIKFGTHTTCNRMNAKSEKKEASLFVIKVWVRLAISWNGQPFYEMANGTIWPWHYLHLCDDGGKVVINKMLFLLQRIPPRPRIIHFRRLPSLPPLTYSTTRRILPPLSSKAHDSRKTPKIKLLSRYQRCFKPKRRVTNDKPLKTYRNTWNPALYVQV